MKLKSLLAVAAALTLSFSAFAATPPATKGAELGKWTMDIPAALELAKTANKPVFINFTGSDWCGWCQMMDKKVFSLPAWETWAQENAVLLWMDFPRDKTLVPDALKPANDALAEQYDIQGFPTYVILGPDGKEVGRLGSDREATPETFIAKIEQLLILLRLEELLSEEDLARYRALEAEQAELEKRINAWMAEVRGQSLAFQTEQNKLLGELDALKAKAISTATAAPEAPQAAE